MIEVHTSTVYDGPMDNYDRLSLLRESVGMMVEYGDATIISEETDGEQSYNAFVSVGGGIVYNIVLTTGRYLTLSKGQIVDGEYQYERRYYNDYWSYRSETHQYIRMRVANGGAAWDLYFRLYGGSSGSSSYSAMGRRIRVVHLISSLDNSERISGLLFNQETDFPYTSLDLVLSNRTFLGLNYVSVNYPQMNVDPNDIILFPTIIYLPSPENGLGVPTIGGETPYFMGIPSGVTLDQFTEFQVNGGRYISLGNVAIRSR